MLKSLQKLFGPSTADQTEDKNLDVKLASATLMFELIKSDGRIDELELSHMKSLLTNQFELSDSDFDKLSVLAQKNADQAISLYEFTREICDNWGNEKRV